MLWFLANTPAHMDWVDHPQKKKNNMAVLNTITGTPYVTRQMNRRLLWPEWQQQLAGRLACRTMNVIAPQCAESPVDAILFDTAPSSLRRTVFPLDNVTHCVTMAIPCYLFAA